MFFARHFLPFVQMTQDTPLILDGPYFKVAGLDMSSNGVPLHLG
jgi:hypothetical protein